jgi:hypothetical protein
LAVLAVAEAPAADALELPDPPSVKPVAAAAPDEVREAFAVPITNDEVRILFAEILSPDAGLALGTKVDLEDGGLLLPDADEDAEDSAGEDSVGRVSG